MMHGSEIVISIHAPAWGATNRLCVRDTKECISIHAPAWGATERLDEIQAKQHFSIHAPAWGATGRMYVGFKLDIHFNPRARVGRDLHSRKGKAP